MRRPWPGLSIALAAPAALVVVGCSGQPPAPQPAQPVPETRPAQAAERSAAPALYKLEDAFLRWPVQVGNQSYAAIDGKHLHGYVVEQVAIARRYRDQGHPQFWGRVIGTSSDAESAQWLVDRFKQAGLSEVHTQPLDLIPQWMPQSWEVAAAGNGKTLPLATAQPAYLTPATRPEGLDLEVAYVGLGGEADFAGRDVRGTAVFVFSMPRPGPGAASAGAVRRAEAKGAAAIFDVMGLPGNLRYQSYPANTNVPTFALGSQDGLALRDLIDAAPAGQAPRVKIRLDVKRVPDLKTALVWGTLPGETDETIYVIAHRDGWFDAAGDNASGVASMVGLAEYFAKIPKSRRRRTMVFVGTDGHHNSTGTGPQRPKGAAVGTAWLVDHRDEFFAKTALMINCEHPSTLQTYLVGSDIRRSNAYTAQQWYAGGPSRPKLQDLAIAAFREFGVSTYAEPNRLPPSGDLGFVGGPEFWRFLPGVATSDFNHYFHTDGETPETVPWTGLEATTRAYAKIVDGVNTLDLVDLQRPPEPAAPPAR